jgi:steroid delta-isomerase-like uncharacterized protein
MRVNRRQALAVAAFAPVASSPASGDPVDEKKSEEIAGSELAIENAGIIRRHHAVMNTGDVVAATQFYAEDTRNHGILVGRIGLLRVLTDIYRTFPDWRMDIQNLAAIDDDVVVRMVVTGTHKGVGKIPVNGGLLVGVPPTGKSFKVQHIHWYTLNQGLIVEHRANRDDVGMMQQLDLLPAAGRYDVPPK